MNLYLIVFTLIKLDNLKFYKKPANKSQVESQINFTFLLVILSLNLSTTNKPVTIGLFLLLSSLF